jgi:hypothetical protein
LRQPAEDIERGWTGVGRHHAIPIAVLASEIAFDGSQHVGIVIDCKQYWSGHKRDFLWRPSGGNPSIRATKNRSPGLRLFLPDLTVQFRPVLTPVYPLNVRIAHQRCSETARRQYWIPALIPPHPDAAVSILANIAEGFGKRS